MSNRFLNFLEAIGRDFKKGLDAILPIAETAGEVAVSIFAPGLGPLFKSTVTAVGLAEQSFTALGKQGGSGTQKAAAAIALVGPLIKQAYIDAGKTGSDAEVQEYLNAVVTILNAIPTTVKA